MTPEMRRKAAAAAAAMLLLERRSQNGLRAAVKITVGNMVKLGARVDHVERVLQHTTHATVLKLRQGVRVDSRKAWQKSTGLAPIETAATADEAHATRAAVGLTKAFRESYAEAREDLEERAAIVTAANDIESGIRRIATTETVSAWNQEISRQNDYAEALGYRVEETWSAMLEACPECAKLDGTTVVRPDRFPDEPPLHPNCRCEIITAEITEPAEETESAA